MINNIAYRLESGEPPYRLALFVAEELARESMRTHPHLQLSFIEATIAALHVELAAARERERRAANFAAGTPVRP